MVRTTGLSLCFSTGEYASPVWNKSKHTKQVNTALNETCRVITGCLKSTPLKYIYVLVGITPPRIRRQVVASIKKNRTNHRPKAPHTWLFRTSKETRFLRKFYFQLKHNPRYLRPAQTIEMQRCNCKITLFSRLPKPFTWSKPIMDHNRMR